ncbi:hypothetical protein GH5_03247 [Leishmania sp. Ghana 2012 LV757]|uniref:hypothetical protein n=1 Tax=Leishmania sp. Ghana 2012 LV757 TaxID=2803181 RepID=UPI001B4A9304|nr:hypothetical protein GH5_03247 [Leishmania sp. Ghana 2012 LV757]
MHPQVRLRRLLRRACAPGVLSSNQVGMTIHALRQLDLLDVSASSPSPSTLPIVKSLCGGADARSQANLLHALASAVIESCDRRTALHEELHGTLQCVQAELVEVADTLTATETVLVMEALLKLMPYVGCDPGTPLVNSRLVEEVRERTMALASVVERPVDLLGVTRVVVEATSSSSDAARDASHGVRLSISNFGWASFALEHVLRVVQARLSTFSKQELISLVDVLTVQRPSAPREDASSPPPFSNSVPPTPTHCEKSRGTVASAERDAETADDAALAAADGVALLDASRPLIPDLLGCALITVPSLSIGQLCAWLTRLTALRLTDNRLLLAVVESLSNADVLHFTLPQLASGASALANLLSLTSAPGQLSVHAEPCLRLYARLLHRLSSALYDAGRDDPAALHHAQTRLLPLLGTVPEAVLNDYIDGAMPKAAGSADSGLRDTSGSLDGALAVRPHVLDVCATLASAIEKAASVLLRFMAALTSREQASVVAAVFYWRVYMPCIIDGSDASTAAASPEPSNLFDLDGQATLKSRDILQRCSPLTLADTARKHRALCGLVTSCSSGFTARDCVHVLNELVLVHYADYALQLRHQQTSQEVQHQPFLLPSAADSSSTSRVQPRLRESVVHAASEERQALMKLLNEQLQGPLQSALSEVHTAQLVRYLSSLSKMGVGARAPYIAVMRHLKDRSLSSFEHVNVLMVVARHHVMFRHVVHGAVRALPELGTALNADAKAKLLKSLGQVNGQRFVKAPCDPTLLPGKFFPTAEELTRLTHLQLVFFFNGLIELRQYENPAVLAVLAEFDKRLCTPLLRPRDSFYSINSATLLAEFLTSLCRLGGPAEGVSAALLLATIQALEQRLTTSRSLFVDLARLNWYWPCVREYFDLSSVLWSDCAASMHGAHRDTVTTRAERWAFTAEEWLRLSTAFARLLETAGARVAERLQDIAKSPSLRPNTFLWSQIVCGLRFGGMPPRGSVEEECLIANLEQRKVLPLLRHPQQLLDITVLALHFAAEGREAEAVSALQFIQRNLPMMRVQDCLQVWWYVSQLLSRPTSSVDATSSRKTTSRRQSGVEKVQSMGIGSSVTTMPLTERARLVLQGVRNAAKEQVLHEEKMVAQKLSIMEKRLLDSLQ